MTDEQDFWNEIVTAAETRQTNCFSATFFQNRNISIIDQQARCFNLCYALSKSGRVRRDTQVAVVGAGVSGMTCAVALAMATNCLVYLFESDSMLLRKFWEAPFRYFHPELNPTAGWRGAGLSGDPSRGTDFAFMNWTGGYGPDVAEQLVRKFDHYRSVAGIALYLGEQVAEITSHSDRVRLKLESGQSLCFDQAILATGFGNERGSGLTNDESYWHSGNPRGYRAIAGRPRRTPERILISGNGDSGVIELAHYLVKDFRHHDIFHYLPNNGIPSRRGQPRLGQWYEAVQQSLVHRRILASVYYDEENPDLPLAAGVLGWYWHMRSLSGLNPHLSMFAGQSSHAIEPQLFARTDAELSCYPRLDRVPADKLIGAQKRASKLLEELASEEIAQFARELELMEIFNSGIRQRMRRDVRVTVVGRSPTVYSVRQAPLNWFLLAVLERFGRFEYCCGELDKPARIVRNEVRTQFGPFDRVIVRHGPAFDSLGYKWRPKYNSIAGGFLHEPLTHYVVDRNRSRLRDAIVDHFRSRYWRQALGRTQDFADLRDSEHSPSQFFTVRHADGLLLVLLGTPSQEGAIALYRRFKKEPTLQGRAKILARLIRMTQKVESQGDAVGAVRGSGGRGSTSRERRQRTATKMP